jgi:hypothetical protein
MTQNARHSLLGSLFITLSACATIVGGGTSQGVAISSDPSGATYLIKSSSGMQMATGRTPQTIKLPRKNEYQIEFSVPGYRSQSIALTKGVNGWVFGNFVFGWIPGFIIDFATGSASKLEPSLVQVNLEKGVANSGETRLIGVVRQLDAKGHVMSEQKIDLVPID